VLSPADERRDADNALAAAAYVINSIKTITPESASRLADAYARICRPIPGLQVSLAGLALFQGSQAMTDTAKTLLSSAIYRVLPSRQIPSPAVAEMALATAFAIVAMSRGKGQGLQNVVTEWSTSLDPRFDRLYLVS
jgi:hypothetical protein